MNKNYKKVSNELIELEEKIEYLENIFGTEKFHELSSIQKTLLIVQKDAMETYATCLNERLNNW
jgi:hypothetical protein